jgi:photosystem II stability/assembly factor-like uncharacterized protein
MRLSILIISLFFVKLSYSQSLYPPALEPNAPDWAKEMLSSDPNVYLVKELYAKYYNANTYEKNNYTQYYKKWVRIAEKYMNHEGKIRIPSAEAEMEQNQQHLNKLQSMQQRGGSLWTSLGPFETVWAVTNEKASWQVNVYCLDKSLSNPNVLYCGTEGSEIYKSTDNGLNWTCVSKNLAMPSAEAIAIHPTNSNIVYFGGGNNLYKTTDGGNNWNIVYSLSGFECTDIIINPQAPNTVMACGKKGLIRSTDGGANWTSIYTDRVWDLEFKPGQPSIVYAAKNNPTGLICEFFKSTDGGATFSIRPNGWYASADPNRQDGGARIAVTPANPEIVYTYLIGQSKSGDNGFIGIWKSTDSGENWTLPHGQVGAPYSCTDANNAATCPFPNLATIGPTGTYHQGFYNMDLAVSATDPDKLLIGGCSFWRSNDGGATFSGVGGYSGSVPRIHPDIQDIVVRGNEVWMASDGGINMSTDFFQTHESRKNGITGSDYWGFGNGWNEDVMVGGRYHNGNSGRVSNYTTGTHIRLGGAENATGYVNPGNNRLVYLSDIGNLLMPATLSSPITWMPSGLYPNESYWASEYSDMVFSPSCYNTVWIGKENKIYRSDDGGVNYSLIYTFGNIAGDWIGPIEIGNEDEKTMYAIQFKYSNNSSQLWKTTDGGLSWTALTMPPGYSRISNIVISPSNKNHIWLAYRQASNGNKIYRSTDGGANWTNITTAMLNGEGIQYMMAQAGTNGGVYLGTGKTVYYRNNAMPDWVIYADNLPVEISTMRFRPFYKESKIRLASYGKGLWEAPLYEPSQSLVCRASVDRMLAFCKTDTFKFVDYSTINHTGATWQWTFQNGTPATASGWFVNVTFGDTGTFKATLKITDANGLSATDTLFVKVTGFPSTTVQEGFEGNFPPYSWKPYNEPNGEPSWKQTNVGAYGLSSKSMFCDNYNHDGNHSKDDFGIGLNLINTTSAKLTFDVAYAKYGGQYSDTLEVIVSTDCGKTFTTLYSKGGSVLATAPDYTTATFVPTAAQWRNDTVSLNNYLNLTDVIVAFRNIANFGQPIYIDNVNITTTVNTTSSSQQIKDENLGIYPNPILSGNQLNINSSGAIVKKVVMFTTEGKILFTRIGENLQTINLPDDLSSGVYTIQIETDKGISMRKLVIGNRRQ